MPDEIDAIIARMSEAQREALLECTPWDVEIGAGIAAVFISYGFLQDGTVLDDGVELTDRGCAVRARLKENTDG